jgi:hypothetical protein
MCQQTDGRKDRQRRVIRSIKLFRALLFFLGHHVISGLTTYQLTGVP